MLLYARVLFHARGNKIHAEPLCFPLRLTSLVSMWRSGSTGSGIPPRPYISSCFPRPVFPSSTFLLLPRMASLSTIASMHPCS